MNLGNDLVTAPLRQGIAPGLSPEPVLFSAILTPNRSLGSSGFVALMAAIGFVSFVAGIAFLMMGAWPVFGFFGLDVLLVYWAFRVSYRRARAFEQVIVTACELTVRKVGAKGESRDWTFNPRWTRLDRVVHPEFGVERLSLVSRGRALPLAVFLGAGEKETFADALSAALARARRGPARTLH